MKKAKVLLASAIAAAVVMLPGCVTNPAKEKIKSYQQGMVFEGSLSIANHELPLPEGKWTYVASHFYINNQNRPFGVVRMIKTEGKLVIGRLSIETSLDEGGTVGYQSSSFCERKDLIYREITNNEAGKAQDCWGINYYVATRPEKPSKSALALLDYIRDHQLERSNVSLYSYHRLTQYGSMVTYRHVTNPDYYSNVDPDPVTSWSSSDWHIDRYYKDPKKVQYIDKVKRQARKLHERIKLGFAVN